MVLSPGGGKIWWHKKRKFRFNLIVSFFPRNSQVIFSTTTAWKSKMNKKICKRQELGLFKCLILLEYMLQYLGEFLFVIYILFKMAVILWTMKSFLWESSGKYHIIEFDLQERNEWNPSHYTGETYNGLIFLLNYRKSSSTVITK